MASSKRSALLCLPIELRYTIYDLLGNEDSVSYPFPNSPVTSISHRAPPRQLLLTCHQLYNEIQTYYYGLAEFRFHALHSSLSKWQDMSAGTLAVLRQARKIKLELVWRIDHQRAEQDPKNWPWWMNQWLLKVVQILLQESRKLDVVVVSLIDASFVGSWEMKAPLLAPLKALRGKMRFKIGEIVAFGDETESNIRRDVEDYVLGLNG